ncbi:hypothetical protein Pla86_15470 [Planctomycetes bacterium Pla86]|uniref:ATP-grasp domain-containing protein n=1 Tax=Engelhardtia mirabilis TaxID=2528011 RepID=A0A518BHP1_9BACT|nr:hypothetical protein Pla133_15480 [Planctomycetes bacterium Pla133]QDV00800.1 hypothetical protein Pla86_15470 [Planctomycetes bacterium Pla86]
MLVLTHSADEYVIDRVDAGVRARGARTFRFDTDTFPGELRLSMRVGDRWRRVARDMRGGTPRELDLERVCAVWSRKIWPGKGDPKLDPAYRASCDVESRAALTGFLDGLDQVPWINRPAAAALAADKLRQLRVAREVGLEIPPTLVTNDPEEVRAFAADVARGGGNLVAKLLTPLSISMGAPPVAVRTSRVPPAALEREALEQLRHAPMVFQAEIPKRTELRIAVVGERVLAGEIVSDGDDTPGIDVDWRRGDAKRGSWRPAEVPVHVAEALARLHRRLGLVYGAVDLIVTPDERCVFLETNPGGEWGMLERDAGLPIGDAIAAALLEPSTGSRIEVEPQPESCP